MATEEGGRERGREEGVVVFNDFRPRVLRHGARDVGQTAVEKVVVLIWTRGKVVELGTCIPAETVKACALIGLHMMADENALRSDGDSSPELRDV